jgi:putative SOS response-associated peptidase YedK
MKAETIASLATFRDGYMDRRCIVPVDNFLKWKAIKGQKTALRHRDESGEPFALAAIWENWKVPHTEEWMRTFCIITTTANELVGQIHCPSFCIPRITTAGLPTSNPIRVTCRCRSRQIDAHMAD